MASKSLFRSIRGRLLPAAETLNEAGGTAYTMTPSHALAQYAATGCLNSVYYATAEEQLATILELCREVPPEFIARTALYARERGNMKDLPALLCAVLSVRSPGLLAEVFDRVIDNPRMLRNFVQIIRSGAVGRKSLGTLPKRLVLGWLEGRSDDAVFRGSVGNDPSVADIVRMVHPKPATASRAALYGYLLGREHDGAALPELVRRFEAFKSGGAGVDAEMPEVPMELLTSLPLTDGHWVRMAMSASWQATRMNLNTFARHGVFDDEGAADAIAAKLRDPVAISKARVFPYQLMVAYSSVDARVPSIVRDALQDAMEIALANVPALEGKVWVLPDVSGSMHSPVTGHRAGGTTAVRCVDVAALIAAAVLRKSPRAGVLPFSNDVVGVDLNPRDSVMTNAAKLAALPAGGTNCSAPLALLNRQKARGDLVIYVSDNESWMDSSPGYRHVRATETMREWAVFKARNPAARLVCLDLQPNRTTQASERGDTLNVGGFSDSVFTVIAEFAAGRLGTDHWVGVIEQVRI